jgi:hypothetical protein
VRFDIDFHRRFLFGIGLRLPNEYMVKIALDGKTQIIFDRGQNNVMSSLRPSPDGRHLYFTQLMWESHLPQIGHLRSWRLASTKISEPLGSATGAYTAVFSSRMHPPAKQ